MTTQQDKKTPFTSWAPQTNESLLADFFAAVQSLSYCDKSVLVYECMEVENIRAEILRRLELTPQLYEALENIFNEKEDECECSTLHRAIARAALAQARGE